MGAVGCVVGASEVTAESVKELVSKLGLTTLAVHGAMNLPDLKGKAPASSPDGAAPGLTLSDGDASMRQALDAAQDAGVDAYIVLANPLVGSPDWADLLAKDSHGNPATEIAPDHPALCPNNAKLLKWLAASVAEVVKTYQPAGVLLNDVSLGPPCNIDALFTCWCKTCEARITELGYDVDRIRIGIMGARSRLEEAGLAPVAFSGRGIGQYLEAVGYDTGLLDWINFRADCVSACLYEIRQAVTGVDGGIRVAVVSKAPTVAMLAGQRRADLTRDASLADIYVPAICGPGSGVLQTIAGHAGAVQAAMPGGSEADAMAFAANVHGYAGMAVPASADEALNSPSPDFLVDSARHELELTMATAGEVPKWPAIDVAGLPAEVVSDVAKLVDETDADGIFYLGVPN